MVFPEASPARHENSEVDSSKKKAAEMADLLETIVPEIRQTLHNATGTDKQRIGRAISSIASIRDAYRDDDFR